jgi:hypothetical protein
MFQGLIVLLVIVCASVGANAQSSVNGAGGVLDDVLLDSINFDYRQKTLVLEQARAMNLTGDNTDVKVTARVKSSDGKTIGAYESTALAPKRNKSYLMRGFLGIEGTQVRVDLPGAGNYAIEFSVGGKVFDRFPFTLTPYSSEAGESWFLLDGLWNDHGLIDISKEFKFSVWMRDMLEGTGKRKSDWGKYSAKIVRLKDGKIIGTTATHTQTQTIAPRRVWTRYDITFVRGQNEAHVGVYDVTAEDGAYAIEFIHDGKLYGKYPFTVRGGKLQGVAEFQGTQLETAAGDLTWMKRTN